jgi:cytidylate kinase
LLEALMKTEARLYHSEYTEELLTKGRDEGAVRYARATLLRMLEAEGEVSAERRTEVGSCADLAQLDARITEHIRPAKG